MAISYQEEIILQGYITSGAPTNSLQWITLQGFGTVVHEWVPDPDAVISASDAHAGEYGMQVVASADNVGAYQVIGFSAGWYCISVYVKVVSGSSASFGILSITDTVLASQTNITDTSYARYSLLVELSGTATIFLHAENDGDVVFFDDVTVDLVPDINSHLQFYNKNYLFLPTRNGLGLFIDQNCDVKYVNVDGSPNTFSFIVRLYPRFAASNTSGVDRYIFKYYCSDNVNDYVSLYYDVGSSIWVLYWHPSVGQAIQLEIQDAQRFLSNTFIELSGWIDINGRVIDSTTYYGKLFVNGIEADSTETVPSVLQNNPDILQVGSLDGDSGFCECIIEELALFVIALEDKELSALFDSEKPLLNINATWSVNYTLATNDILIYDAATGENELYDVSISSTIPIGHLIASGARAPTLRGGENEEATLYFPVAIDGEIRIVYRPHWP